MHQTADLPSSERPIWGGGSSIGPGHGPAAVVHLTTGPQEPQGPDHLVGDVDLALVLKGRRPEAVPGAVVTGSLPSELLRAGEVEPVDTSTAASGDEGGGAARAWAGGRATVATTEEVAQVELAVDSHEGEREDNQDSHDVAARCA